VKSSGEALTVTPEPLVLPIMDGLLHG
jgi:hypothetical protein